MFVLLFWCTRVNGRAYRGGGNGIRIGAGTDKAHDARREKIPLVFGKGRDASPRHDLNRVSRLNAGDTDAKCIGGVDEQRQEDLIVFPVPDESFTEPNRMIADTASATWTT
jgi:hypothetical protein